MELASFTGFIRTLVYIILGYYAIKFLARIFAPILMQKAVSKVQEKMEEQMRQQQNYQQNQSQSYTQTKKAEMPKEKKKVGEYIEFEEIE